LSRALVWAVAAVVVGVIMLAAIMAGVAGGVPSSAGAGYGASRFALKDIPPEFLAMYQAAAAEEGLDWTILAGIGRVETNHCRSKMPGVHSGTNGAGAAGCMQFLAGTWQIYGKGGDVYDPADSIPAAARLLKASGAPKDYHRAIFAYNHLESYVASVMRWAARYRGPVGGTTGSSAAVTLDPGAQWLMPVPGTGAICDRRIVQDVVWILDTYHAALGDCYAASGHEAGGEHPLGLAVDLVPGPDGSWDLLDKLAHDMGWRESCAASGCNESRANGGCFSEMLKPFCFIGWNGYPGHGAGDHIHLSWQHSSGRPAGTVYTLRS
jgi:hypothetical protein